MTPMKRIIKADKLTRASSGNGAYNWDLGSLAFQDPIEVQAKRKAQKKNWYESVKKSREK